MKTSQDPRHQKRIDRMQQLFAYSFQQNASYDLISSILPALTDLDTAIQNAAPEWPTDKIAKIDLAILRLSVYELTVEKTEPPKVIIDEAVELAKAYGNEHSPKFINGVLGTILKDVIARSETTKQSPRE
ncbi:transcription antitermination factor NusB [Candidatus Gottesmanbacteria bacterium]|nr:transcription antitermination factor NusB [Candidatus Gottesmanbacteria bacterium]